MKCFKNRVDNKNLELKINLIENQLLSTIKVPKNLRMITERLPKSQYEFH